ncbi:hypothetical protein [Maricaulis sp.]|uniref:hypothetical protein n=1 Tax=Maricaulis sp. TaxID=1486257 RepID=UPI0026244D5B|nr:hypothetical protein [Maricaulis sp.]
MALIWVLLGSIVGISAMVAANHYLGLHTPAVIASLDDAKRKLDIDAVGFQPGRGVLAEDGRSALVEEAGASRIGLLSTQGDTVVIRYLDPGSVRAARMEEGGAITLSLNDFTFAPIRLGLGDAGEARMWADKLNALQA